MITPGGIGNNFTDTDDLETGRGRSTVVKVISIIAAVAVTAALLIGFMLWRKQHEEQVGVATEQPAKAKSVKAALPVKVQIYMDEAVRKGPEAIIGGTVHNISDENLSNVSLEVELSHRKDAETEIKTLSVEPRDLAPDQKGRYSLVLTGDYRSIKLLGVKSGPASDEIGFKTAPGAPRPVEQAPHTTKTVVVGERPSAPKKGEEFINTPDNPARIP